MATTDSVAGPGWGAKLTGHQFDLEDWLAALMPPFDPWVERRHREDGEAIILRSAELDQLNSAEEVRERATVLIERLNGVMFLLHHGQPVRFLAVAEIHSDGRVHLHHYAQLEGLGMRIRGGFVGLTHRAADGTFMPPPPPTASSAQRMATRAQADDRFAELFGHFARASNWYDLYKTIEIMEGIVGSEHALQQLLGADGPSLKLIRTTANFYRHAPGRAHRPPTPAKLNESRTAVGGFIMRVFDNRPSAPGGEPP